MVDVAAISGLIGSLKAASDIVRAMIGLRDAETFRSKAIELQGLVGRGSIRGNGAAGPACGAGE